MCTDRTRGLDCNLYMELWFLGFRSTICELTLSICFFDIVKMAFLGETRWKKDLKKTEKRLFGFLKFSSRIAEQTLEDTIIAPKLESWSERFFDVNKHSGLFCQPQGRQSENSSRKRRRRFVESFNLEQLHRNIKPTLLIRSTFLCTGTEGIDSAMAIT